MRAAAVRGAVARLGAIAFATRRATGSARPEMWRYKLARGAVNGLERGSHAAFGAMRWGIGRLERRDEKRRAQAALAESTDPGAASGSDPLSDPDPPGPSEASGRVV